MYIVSIFVPKEVFENNIIKFKDNPSGWNYNITSGYGYGVSYGSDGKQTPAFFPPNDEKSIILSKSIQLFKLRYNPIDSSPYVDFNHKITHPHGLHFNDNLNAYIRINELGDPVEEIKIIFSEEGNLVTFQDELLNFHCRIGDYVHLRLFDFLKKVDAKNTELFDDTPNHWNQKDLVAKTGSDIGYTWLRGFQIIPNTMSDDEFWAIMNDEKPRKYCKFLVDDFKHGKLRECSSKPDCIGNYFVASDLPFGTSPAFFNKEVLKKYKDNPEKYTLNHWDIVCRDSWSLRYSINDSDQVVVFLIDLSYLPFKEQLNWKQYNEKPITGLSDITFKRAFLGEFVDDKDPLVDLQNELENDIIIDSIVIWKAPKRSEIDEITYLTANIQKEWQSDIQIIHKVIVESFSVKAIKSLMIKNGISPPEDKEYKSLKLLEYYFSKHKTSDDKIKEIMMPFFEINGIRSKLSTHRQGKEAEKILKHIKKEFGSFINHQKHMVIRLLDSIRLLRNEIDKIKELN